MLVKARIMAAHFKNYNHKEYTQTPVYFLQDQCETDPKAEPDALKFSELPTQETSPVASAIPWHLPLLLGLLLCLAQDSSSFDEPAAKKSFLCGLDDGHPRRGDRPAAGP